MSLSVEGLGQGGQVEYCIKLCFRKTCCVVEKLLIHMMK